MSDRPQSPGLLSPSSVLFPLKVAPKDPHSYFQLPHQMYSFLPTLPHLGLSLSRYNPINLHLPEQSKIDTHIFPLAGPVYALACPVAGGC